MSLKMVDVSFAYDKNKAPLIDQLNMTVSEGEFVSLVGGSGSGKSTIFKLITGLYQQDRGEIWIDGEPCFLRRGQAGYMPQNDLLLPWRTILENVILPSEVMKTDRKREKVKCEVKEWLKRCGLAAYEDAYPHELSGGMKQRVAFVRTVMTGKNLLLLDEPFGALDSLTKREMQGWLLSLWEEMSKTVLFITHDLEEAILLSDRIYLINRGEGDFVKEFYIDLPRPRNPEIIHSSKMLKYRGELERLIQNG